MTDSERKQKNILPTWRNRQQSCTVVGYANWGYPREWSIGTTWRVMVNNLLRHRLKRICTWPIC